VRESWLKRFVEPVKRVRVAVRHFCNGVSWMSARLRVLSASVLFMVFLPVCGFAPDVAPAPTADLIVTAAPIYNPLAALRPASQSEERFPQGARLLRIHEGKAEPLLKDFAASADAQLSYDGEKVLFAGKKDAPDPWQIYELTLKDGAVRRVQSAQTDLVRPFYLPAGRMVYARHGANGFQLEAADLDGRNITQLTFLPASVLPSDVLQDGRILFEAGYPLGTGATPELFRVYSDGSGVDSYRCDHGQARWAGHQLASGDVVFTHGASLARFTSAQAQEVSIVAPRAEYSGAIAETAEGAWLMSARSTPTTRYALKLWKPGASALQTLLAMPDANLIEPVVIAAHTRPRRHPVSLHDWSYANLLALNARESRNGELKTSPSEVRMEMLDAHGHVIITGKAPVEADGSFFVKAQGNAPIRFSLLDAKGNVLRQEHGWFWIRSGEQRICVGCHVGPERAPENNVPAVLLHTTTPVDLTGAKSENSAEGK